MTGQLAELWCYSGRIQALLEGVAGRMRTGGCVKEQLKFMELLREMGNRLS